MASSSKFILVGNLGADPVVRWTTDGKGMATFNVAEKDSYTAGGVRKEETHWHKVVVFGKAKCEVIEKFLKKGSAIYVEGKLRYRKYTDKHGVERTVAEIHCEEFQMMGSPSRQQSQHSQETPAQKSPVRETKDDNGSQDGGPPDEWLDAYNRAESEDSTRR